MITIPADVLNVLDKLENAGFGAYVVGGCVRDSLMNKTPNDWDVTTSASPEEIKTVFSEYRTVDTSIQHGTVLVISNETPVEVTTFRIDGKYSDGRHPDNVTFTDKLSDDLARRDFTVNAMAYNPKTGIIDIFGGVEDIEKKLIRCVGDADLRFNEDALRILRAMRFSSVLGFDIEEKTAEALVENENLLSAIAAERINSELLKLLCGNNVLDVLLKYKSVLGVFMPEIKLEFDHKQLGKKHAYDIWTHTAHTVNNIENDPVLRLTMLLHDTGKPATHQLNENGDSTFKNHAAVGGVIAENILRRLKFSKNIINTVSYLVSIHDREVPETRIEVKEYLRDLGEENFIRLMKIRRADKSALAEDYRDINSKLIFAYTTFDDVIESDEPYSIRQLKIKGSDLKNKVPDNRIGETLEYLLCYVIRSPEKNNKQELLAIADSLRGNQD